MFLSKSVKFTCDLARIDHITPKSITTRISRIAIKGFFGLVNWVRLGEKFEKIDTL